MIQATHIDAGAATAGLWSQPPTVIVITPEAAVFNAVQATLGELDGRYEIVHAPEPGGAAQAEQAQPTILYCLQCPAETEAGQNALALIRNLAGDTPILLLDDGTAGLDVETAVAAGAWNLIALDKNGLLRIGLTQALEIGRHRIELQEAGQRLNQAQRRLDVLLSQGDDARASLVGHRIVDANAAFARLLDMDDAENVHGADLLEQIQKNDHARLLEAIDLVVRDKTDTALVFELATRDNQHQPIRALLQPGVEERNDERRINVVFQAADGSRPLAAERARPPTSHDGRMALHAVLAQTIGRAQEHVLGLVFVAVDDIPRLQKNAGLAQSDMLLQEAGLFLLQHMRGEDRIFRFGAGEYVLLIERHSRSEVTESAEKLHTMLSDTVFGDDHTSTSLPTSMAHTLLTGDAPDNDRRLQALMTTAYELREAGGNACHDCSATGIEGADDAGVQQWATRLQQALAQDRFSLAYQGITSLAGDSQPYFDCLLRYIDDRGALVRPGEFLPAAERAGMMAAIDRWVTRRAIEVIVQQRARGTDIALFVKLSVATIDVADAFLSWTQEALETRPIPHHQLIFTIREDDVRTRNRVAQILATELDSMGFRIALTLHDNTSNAIQLLDDMPVAFIKLGPNFARQMMGAGSDQLLTDILATARERQIPLIAEQVEDANSMARLWQTGVNYVQGHFIQEPDTEALTHTGRPLD